MSRAAARRGYSSAARTLLSLCAALPLAVHVHAFEARRVSRSLKDEPTVFVRATSAPASEWRRAAVDSSFESRTRSSQFGPASGPDSVFRAAEVAPERVTLTRRLLTELNVRQTPQQAIVIDLPADVLFDFDKATLRRDAQSSLEKAAELLRSYPDAPVVIDGHTDGKGTDAYNDALSMRRAKAVTEALDAGTRTFTTHGYGKRRPVVANQRPDGSDDPAARQRNRRVEITIQPTGT